MAIQGNYAPPGVYTETTFDAPDDRALESVRVPVIIGTGRERLTQVGLEVVRGSSSSVDQRVPQENVSSRAVVSEDPDTGAVTLGSFDGERTSFQVQHFPIVTGNGSGTPTNDASSLLVEINGQPTVVLAVDGLRGVVDIAEAPGPEDEVLVTYFFNREDTRITDNVSKQVDPEPAVLFGQVAQPYSVVAGDNDTLALVVDGTARTMTIPEGEWSASQVSAILSNVPGLTASSYVNNLGQTLVRIQANQSLSVGDGTANTLLGLTRGASTDRTRTFFTFQGPIVDGSNGGITTTDPSDVVVRVNGQQVIPASVDGQSRAITLPFAPAPGSEILVTYFFNSWQDTFDYLAHRGILDVERCGITPDRRDFIEGADFVIVDDKIVWGTAALVESGIHTAGARLFGPQQVSTMLVDNRAFLERCETITDTTSFPPATSKTRFRLPYQPTTGNGRDTPLGSSLFLKVSNNRVDLPTNRPDLVIAYWGFGIQDALDRGPVAVTEVNAQDSTFTLKHPVPTGADVFATFYYNTLTDSEFTLESVTDGASGVGEYRVLRDGERLFEASLASKGPALATIPIRFPSGSELNPDARIEPPLDATLFQGPVEETVTVRFLSRDDTPAKYTFPGPGPYFHVARETTVGPGPYYAGPYTPQLTGASNRLRLTLDNLAAQTGIPGGVDINNPTGTGSGFTAVILGDEIEYDPATGTTFEVTALNNDLTLNVDGQQVFVTVPPNPAWDAGDVVGVINAAADTVPPRVRASTQFTAFTVAAGEYDRISLHYTGDLSLQSGVLTATIAPGTYNTPSLLAEAVENAIETEVQNLVTGDPNFAGLAVMVSGDASGRMFFTLERADGDNAGFLEFISDSDPGRDFATLAGLDTDDIPDGRQTKVLSAPIARRFTVSGTAGDLQHDRILLRNRLVPGRGTQAPGNVEEQAFIRVEGGSGTSLFGLLTGTQSVARAGAVVRAASLFGRTGWFNGQASGFGDERDGQPLVTFFDGQGIRPANNRFSFVFDGLPVNVEFPASATGTSIPLGPASVPDTVLYRIADAMADAGLQNSVSDVLADGFVRQEGAGIRFTSGLFSKNSRIEIGTGSANGALGFSPGASATRQSVDPSALSSALMAHAHPPASVSSLWLQFDADSQYFAGRALAGIETDDAGAQFLFIQSQTLGVSSSIAIQQADFDDANLQGTGLLGREGDGAAGEAGFDGFVVTSSDTGTGSGSANTSFLNDGVGQDGVVGQTYRDLVTGLTFTILPREGGGSYPVGPNGFFTFRVSSTLVTDSNLPVRLIPGVEMRVSDTTSVPEGDTAILTTVNKGGAEPAIGDLYYITYDYRKQDFTTRLFTRLTAVERAYGRKSVENPVTLGVYLQFLNGSVLTAVTQVPRDEGSRLASESSFVAAVDSLRGGLPGLVFPDLLIPLTPATESFAVFMGQHCDQQSSIRFRAERTAILGFRAGTLPSEAGRISQAVQRDRVRFLYPDIARLTLTDALGNREQSLVDGTYIAAAFSGSRVSPNIDVATPWTNAQIIGFDGLARTLDPVQQNEVAVRGVTVVEEGEPFLRVRHGLTSDMSSVLTRTPTVRQIADDVQQNTRDVLDRFIGIKYLPTVLGQVEGRVSQMFRAYVRAQIVASYTGISATPDPDDPVSALVRGAYRPIFPLLYLLVEYALRSTD